MKTELQKLSFSELKRKYNLPSYMGGPSNLRWKTPIEKGIAWEVMRQIIHKEEKDCYTCGAKDLVANDIKADCGHCYPVAVVGSNNKLSWVRKLIHLQCSRCNGAGQGEQAAFEEHLRQDYGDAFVEEMRQRRHKTDPIRDWASFLEELWKTLRPGE